MNPQTLTLFSSSLKSFQSLLPTFPLSTFQSRSVSCQAGCKSVHSSLPPNGPTTLRDNKLKYFLSASSITPCGTFDFNQLTALISTLDSSSFFLEFNSCPTRFVFKAESFEDLQQWLAGINTHILSSLGSEKILFRVASIPNFWKKRERVRFLV
jgi:hypothetical protein